MSGERVAVPMWGFPNFGMATKAHLFKPGRSKSACGKHDRDSVIILTPDTGARHPHVDCSTCAKRAAS